jgi:hypothetical protein
MEQQNLLFCGLPRFRRDVGPGGLDGIYCLGYLLTQLRQGKVEEYLLGFYAYTGINMDRDTLAGRETNLLYTSDLHRATSYRTPDVGDPLPSGSAVSLVLLRHLLVTEEVSGAGEYSGALAVLPAVPRRWFLPGEKIVLRNLPTHFGPLSLETQVTDGEEGRILQVDLQPPPRHPWRKIRLRLPHPKHQPMKSVTVNGWPYHDFVADSEEVVLLPGEPSYRVVVLY